MADKNVGKITQIISAVLDIKFTEGKLPEINDAIDIPVIASGGGGNPAHILDVFQKTDVSAALAASIFHFNQYSINDVKQYLKENNVPVRL